MCWTTKKLWFTCCCKMPTLAVGHTYPAVVCVLGGVSLGASDGIMDHTSTSGAGTKNVWELYIHSCILSWNARDNCTLRKSFNS
jgi:hypothetical protein